MKKTLIYERVIREAVSQSVIKKTLFPYKERKYEDYEGMLEWVFLWMAQNSNITSTQFREFFKNVRSIHKLPKKGANVVPTPIGPRDVTDATPEEKEAIIEPLKDDPKYSEYVKLLQLPDEEVDTALSGLKTPEDADLPSTQDFQELPPDLPKKQQPPALPKKDKPFAKAKEYTPFHKAKMSPVKQKLEPKQYKGQKTSATKQDIDMFKKQIGQEPKSRFSVPTQKDIPSLASLAKREKGVNKETVIRLATKLYENYRKQWKQYRNRVLFN